MNNSNKKLNNKKYILGNNKRAFTLVEVIVAIGIFVIVMGGSVGAFASAFKSYKGAKNVNENLKNAQYAMNLMAKTFRTSSIKHSSSNLVIVYDWSQSLCIRYVFTGVALTKAFNNTVTESSCDSGTLFSAANTRDITTGTVTGEFRAVNSAGDDGGPSSMRVGRVTVVMNITNSGGGSSSSARIQSTSSLRDYTVSNVGIDPNNDPNL